jgi:hypothetical protein
MPNIFISYRREDSLGHTGRLFDRLGKHFGKAHVFMDIAGIEPGLDFVESIDKAVGSCDVFIVVIGKQWLNATDADGRRRLENPEDFIRLELATALKRNIRVIPVLVQGATAPSSENLPEDLRMLSRRQAIEVSDNRWDFDAGELIKTIEKSLRGKYPLRFWWSKIPRWAIVVSVLTLFVIGVSIFEPSGPRIEPGIEMPNVVGERFEKAKAILEGKGLSVSTSEKQTAEKPPGTVVDQKPEPSAKLKKGDGVELVLAVKTVLEQGPMPGAVVEPGPKVGLAVPTKPAAANEQQRQMARNLANEWFVAACKQQDVGALARMASIPFLFDNEVLHSFEDIEGRYKNFLSKVALAPKDMHPRNWRVKEIKAQTVAEWKRGGYDVQRDRFFNKMEYKDSDYMTVIPLEMGSGKQGDQHLYMRNVGGQIKMAGFWM